MLRFFAERFVYWKKVKALKSKHTQIHRSVVINSFDNITVGEYAYLGPAGFYDSRGGIHIGDGTILSSFVKVLSSSHKIGDGNILPYSSENLYKPVIIGSGVWVGMNSIIMPGVILGDAVIVGAGSIVTKSFGHGAVIAGNPAKLLRVRHYDNMAIKNKNFKTNPNN